MNPLHDDRTRLQKNSRTDHVPLQGDRCPFCSSSNLGEVRIERAFASLSGPQALGVQRNPDARDRYGRGKALHQPVGDGSAQGAQMRGLCGDLSR